MAKDTAGQPDYTSPPPSQLKVKPRSTEYDFIASVRSGKRSLMTLAKGKPRFLKLMKDGFIERGFVLLNPRLLEGHDGRKKAHSPRLYLLFLKADARVYFPVKQWIISNHERHNLSAYTTLGNYDFIVRLVSTEEEVEEMCDELKSTFPSLNEDSGPDRLPHLLRIYVNRFLCYDRTYVLPSSTPNIDLLGSDERRWLLEVNEELHVDRIERSHIKQYEELREKEYILGTRCLVNTPRLHNIITFILLQYQEIDQLQKVLNSESLNKNIIDAFTITAPRATLPYSALLVCEFSGSSNPLCAYNRWMDDFYWSEPGLSCLTFESDSTICEVPDVYESAVNLKRTVEKQWSNRQGIYVGNGVWFKNEKSDLKAYMDHESLIYGGCIVGGTRSGKTNTCLHIASEIRKKDIDVLIISFKPGAFAPDLIKAMGGETVLSEDFLKINLARPSARPKLMFVETDMQETGRRVAEHCLALISKDQAHGTQKPLNFVVFLDEILNIKDKVEELVDGSLVPALNTCAESGIGILVTAQGFGQWDRLWAICSNRFIHAISTIDSVCSVISEIPLVPGLGADVSVGIKKLQQGQMVCSVVTRSKEELPAIVVQVPLVK
jgi:hypothetical protein